MKTTGRQAVPKHGDLNRLPADLLVWFDKHGRDLPWRTALGERRDPYRVWLAEIMLQQTTIPHGTPYFHAFTKRWPTVEALAEAKDEDVMAAWAGLGYYARARNLLKCAREVLVHYAMSSPLVLQLRCSPQVMPVTPSQGQENAK